MRTFDYKREYKKLLSADIVSLLTAIHEYKGRQIQVADENTDVLTQLVEIAKIQSTDASNKIEGISTSDERLQKIAKNKTRPTTRSEKEIAGYRDVLSTIHESYDYIPPRSSMILQLHRDLYKFTGSSIGGNYKNSDNVIAEEHADGTKTVRFQPVPAWETPEYVNAICAAYNDALHDDEIDVLALIPMFILDFLCVHPFNDGNGRMSRLLTLLLLYRAGYTVGKYISIEKLIADSKETYYEVLQDSSFDWHEGKNDYAPFVRYMLGVVVAAYREFESRAALIVDSDFSKSDRVREVIKGRIGPITKSEIMRECPDISQVTVQRALGDLLKSEQIIKLGGGRYTKYVWNFDKE
ncbi:MAG: Fic family protein [Clostridia bacterium]|nr:Fic family protein [Clostridia bacterium]